MKGKISFGKGLSFLMFSTRYLKYNFLLNDTYQLFWIQYKEAIKNS